MGAGSLLSWRHGPKVHNRADKNVHCWQWMEQTGRDWLLITAMDVGGRWRKDEIMGHRRLRVLLKPLPCAHFQALFQVLLYSCHARLSMLMNSAWRCWWCVAYFVIATGCCKLNCCFCSGVGHTGTYVAKPYLPVHHHVCLNQTPVGTFLEQHRVTFLIARQIQDAAVSFEWLSPC